jgi:hypothetical protein
MTSDLDRDTKRRLDRALTAARFVMLWEQGWAIWAPLLLAAAFIAVAGLWGVFERLPAWADAVAVAAAVVVGTAFAVRGALSLRWPTREETSRRVETDSRLVHRPLASLSDTPAAGDPELWALHRARAVEAIAKTRVGRPKAGIAKADPFALRYLLLVAAALALWARGPESLPQAQMAFRPAANFATATGHAFVSVRAWAADSLEQLRTAPARRASPNDRAPNT